MRARAGLLPEIVAEGPEVVRQVMRLVAPIDTAMTVALARALTVRGNHPSFRATGYLMLANVDVARGRLARARPWLDSLALVSPARAAEHRAVLATLPWLPVDRARAASALRALERVPLPRIPSYDLRGEVALHQPELLPIRRLYLIALLSERLGDTARAEALATELAELGGPDTLDVGQARELAGIIRAERALKAGDATRALALLGEPGTHLDASLPDLSAYPKARRRFLRAEALAKMGRSLDAVVWYATFPDPSSYDLAYVGPAMLAASRSYATLGNARLADSLAQAARARWPAAAP
jgi:hypothetical protein